MKTHFLRKYLSIRNAGIKTWYKVARKDQYHGFSDTLSKGYTLSFSDDFNFLDEKKWRMGQPWGEFHPSNPHQYFDKDEIRVENGILSLGGSMKPKQFHHKDSLITIPYAIGLINSDISFKQKYGYFEIRSKNPSGPATWPAFWLTGATKWPPEIDIFEMYGKSTGQTVHKQCYTVHWGKSDTRSRGFFSRSVGLKQNTDSSFHIYACEWTPGSISFYTDGKLSGYFILNKRLRKWLDEEMVVIINNSFDEPYLKFLPLGFRRNSFEVDWVRVYRKK